MKKIWQIIIFTASMNFEDLVSFQNKTTYLLTYQLMQIHMTTLIHVDVFSFNFYSSFCQLILRYSANIKLKTLMQSLFDIF